MRKFTQLFWASLFLLFSIAFNSCKEEDEHAGHTVFSVNATDSLQYELSEVKTIQLVVESPQDRDFNVELTNLEPGFTTSFHTFTLHANESFPININFNQFGKSAGTYPCKLKVTPVNSNETGITKTIPLIYKPNCAFNYRNYVHGEITFVSNGILLQKNIVCTFNETGQLEVEGLTTYTVILNFDCDSQTFVMKPTNNIGSFMTANGQIQGTELLLSMFSNGSLHATAKIKS